MGMITNDWVEPLSTEFRKPYYKDLYNETNFLSKRGREAGK